MNIPFLLILHLPTAVNLHLDFPVKWCHILGQDTLKWKNKAKRCTNKLNYTESFQRILSASVHLELTWTYLLWVLQKWSHLMMPWWTMLSCSHWTCAVLFSLDMNALSCSFHWSISSMMTFRSCESYRKTVTCFCVVHVFVQAQMLLWK